MKTFAILTIVALTGITALPAHATDSMSMGGKMATCASSNPAVIVNTTKMTYMMDTKANRTAMTGMMEHDKFVCKSTATKMGAKAAPHAMHGDSMGSAMKPMAAPTGKM